MATSEAKLTTDIPQGTLKLVIYNTILETNQADSVRKYVNESKPIVKDSKNSLWFPVSSPFSVMQALFASFKLKNISSLKFLHWKQLFLCRWDVGQPLYLNWKFLYNFGRFAVIIQYHYVRPSPYILDFLTWRHQSKVNTILVSPGVQVTAFTMLLPFSCHWKVICPWTRCAAD